MLGTIVVGLMFSVPPSLGAWSMWMVWARLRGTEPPRCGVCRYDRAGIEPDARCPECGASGAMSARAWPETDTHAFLVGLTAAVIAATVFGGVPQALVRSSWADGKWWVMISPHVVSLVAAWACVLVLRARAERVGRPIPGLASLTARWSGIGLAPLVLGCVFALLYVREWSKGRGLWSEPPVVPIALAHAAWLASVGAWLGPLRAIGRAEPVIQDLDNEPAGPAG